MRKKKKDQKSKKLMVSIVTKSVGAILVVSLIMAVVGVIAVRHAYTKLYEEELITATNLLRDKYDGIAGDWSVTGENLYKGHYNVSSDIDTMDELKEQTGLDYTIFYGNVSMASSLILPDGTRAVGTEATDDITSAVYKDGEEVYLENIDILGMPYYGYYVPLYDESGAVCGMAFAGRETSDLSGALWSVFALLLLIGLAVATLTSLVGVFYSKKMTRDVKDMADGVTTMTTGDLHVQFMDETLGRPDEIGQIARETDKLRDKLANVIQATKELGQALLMAGNELNESSTQAGQAADQVACAVEDIAKGAMAQAEHTQEAAENMDEMGMNIDKIAANAENMNSYSEEMRVSCDQTVEALNRLSEQSDDTAVAIRNIGDSIRTTNESVNAIAEAAGAIEGIATQTNLLALNASIEAARAGEQGRGFAVVASEIGTLAAQSKDATKRIEEIVKALVEQSEENITTMQGLDEGMTLQMEQLDNTKNNMNSMAANVNNVSDGMEEVAESIEHLKKAKDAMVEIVEGLSAISEENAASTEETNASVQELDSTFELISGAAETLAFMAQDLESTVSFFH